MGPVGMKLKCTGSESDEDVMGRCEKRPWMRDAGSDMGANEKSLKVFVTNVRDLKLAPS